MENKEKLIAERTTTRSVRGLIISIISHICLIVGACWIVFRQPLPPPKKEYISHNVAGGRTGGPESAKSHLVKPHPKMPLMTKRIASKSASSTLVLPPVQSISPQVGLGGQSLGGGKGGQGFGRGLGGSNGQGMGLGNRAGFVGRPVMGAVIHAHRVAVYLDCSGSMRSYLPRVEAEIRKQFPDADVFRFDGARVVGLDEYIVYGRRFRGEAPRLREGPTQTNVETLTAAGKAVQVKVRTACEKGSLGAWLDRLIVEPYDALVVFSDFQDGVRLYEMRKGEPKLYYSDSSYNKIGTPPQNRPRWQHEWLEAFAKAGKGAGPKLYLFSVQQQPQSFLQACVNASGGSATLVTWLKKGGNPSSP